MFLFQFLLYCFYIASNKILSVFEQTTVDLVSLKASLARLGTAILFASDKNCHVERKTHKNTQNETFPNEQSLARLNLIESVNWQISIVTRLDNAEWCEYTNEQCTQIHVYWLSKPLFSPFYLNFIYLPVQTMGIDFPRF